MSCDNHMSALGLVRRTVYPEVPVRVEYALTEAEAGGTLREPLRALEEWSIAHLGDESASQQAHEPQGLKLPSWRVVMC